MNGMLQKQLESYKIIEDTADEKKALSKTIQGGITFTAILLFIIVMISNV